MEKWNNKASSDHIKRRQKN